MDTEVTKMKRINKLICLALALALLLCVLPAPAGAVSAALETKYGKYIDFAKLKTSFSSEAGVRLKIGGLPFWGKLRISGELTDEQIEDAINKALNEREINLTDLAAYEAAKQLAKEYAEDNWSAKAVMETLCKILGVSEAVDVFDALLGTFDKSLAKFTKDQILDTLKGSAIENAVKSRAPQLVGKLGLKTAGFTVSCLVNAGEVSAQEFYYWLTEEKVQSEGEKAAEELKAFYNAANKRLAMNLQKTAEDWEIAFDNVSYTRKNMTLFDVGGISQTYTVNASLKREPGSRAVRHEDMDLTDISGTYTGRFNVRVTHQLYNLDNALMDMFIKTRLYDEFSELGMQFMGMSLKPSTLTKTVFSDDLSVTVTAPPNAGVVSYIPLDLSAMEQVVNFDVGYDISFAHTDASVDPSGTADGQGYVHGGGGGGWLTAKDYMFQIVFAGEPEGMRGVRLEAVGMREIGSVSGSIEGHGFSESINEYEAFEGGNTVIGEDNQIFAELDMNSSMEVGWLVQNK